MVRLELDEHIDIALGPEVVAQHGAKERQLPDVMAPAEVGDLFTIERHLSGHGQFWQTVIDTCSPIGAKWRLAWFASTPGTALGDDRMEDRDNDYVTTRQFGHATVTVIHEGAAYWAPELTAPEEEWRAAMPEADEVGRILLDHHVVHIRLGDASVLIDAGLDDPSSAWGENWLEEWPGARRTPGLQAGLRSIGVHPEEITHVVITHVHYDHVVGVTVERDGRQVPRYPNARVLLGRGDWEGNPERGDPASDIAIRLGTIERSGLLDLVEGDREVAPGLWMLHAPGESPGHSIVRLTSGDACFYALGDLFHHACEVEHPDWSVPWVDKAAMRSARERLMREAARTDATLVFAHEPFPPWGRIVQVDGGYRWQRG